MWSDFKLSSYFGWKFMLIVCGGLSAATEPRESYWYDNIEETLILSFKVSSDL